MSANAIPHIGGDDEDRLKSLRKCHRCKDELMSQIRALESDFRRAHDDIRSAYNKAVSEGNSELAKRLEKVVEDFDERISEIEKNVSTQKATFDKDIGILKLQVGTEENCTGLFGAISRGERASAEGFKSMKEELQKLSLNINNIIVARASEDGQKKGFLFFGATFWKVVSSGLFLVIAGYLINQYAESRVRQNEANQKAVPHKTSP